MRSRAFGVSAFLIAGCAHPPKHAPPPSAPPPSAPASVTPPTASAPPPPAASTLSRLTTLHGCTGAAHADSAALPASQCTASGTRAFVYGIAVPLGDGTFVEVGVYGGSATLDVPSALDMRTHVKVTEPLEVDGMVVFDHLHVALAHREGGRVHPTLKLAPGAPVLGVADGDHFRARVRLGDDFAVGPIDLPCSAIALGDDNELDDTFHPKPRKHATIEPKGPALVADRKDQFKIAATPRTGVLHAGWQGAAPLVKATIDATDGVRLLDLFGFGAHEQTWWGEATLEVLDRQQGHLKIRAGTKSGTELVGWVKTEDVYVPNGGRGEGIGLCGCGHGTKPSQATAMLLAPNAPVHARPNGPKWAKAPNHLVEVIVADGDHDGWHQMVFVDRFSEGGDACASERLEHAWVRTSDLRAR